ncbi:MAG: hypothetical protein M4579_006398 [Chaenotheca gracillima]|nr:MAG: hypothetical protein M4579_006398 [Chaenotheca gracillima]
MNRPFSPNYQGQYQQAWQQPAQPTPQYGQNQMPPPAPYQGHPTAPPPQPGANPLPKPHGSWAIPGPQQQWNVPGPPPVNNPAAQASSSYNPGIYGHVSGSQHSPASPSAQHPPNYNSLHGEAQRPFSASPAPPQTFQGQHGQPNWNQQYQAPPDQQHYQKPPLPPRPLSPNYNPEGPWSEPPQQPPRPYSSSQQNSSQAPPQLPPRNAQQPPASVEYQGQSEQPNQIPPPPPPLPPGYQAEIQQTQQNPPYHAPYSQQPQSHNYEPGMQQGSQGYQVPDPRNANATPAQHSYSNSQTQGHETYTNPVSSPPPQNTSYSQYPPPNQAQPHQDTTPGQNKYPHGGNQLTGYPPVQANNRPSQPPVTGSTAGASDGWNYQDRPAGVRPEDVSPMLTQSHPAKPSNPVRNEPYGTPAVPQQSTWNGQQMQGTLGFAPPQGGTHNQAAAEPPSYPHQEGTDPQGRSSAQGIRTNSQPQGLSASQPPNIGASVLGFGGPSDWEHFSANGEEQDGLEDTPIETYGRPPFGGANQVAQSSVPPLRKSTFDGPGPLQNVMQPNARTDSARRRAPPPPKSTADKANSTTAVQQHDFGTQINPPPEPPPIVTADKSCSTTVVQRHDFGTQITPAPEPAKPIQREMSTQTAIVKPVERRDMAIQTLAEEIKVPDLRTLGTQTDAPDPSTPSDPYDDLDKWYKDSLTRYVETLRFESQAGSGEDRTKIFTEFMMRESRLRGLRYGSATLSKDTFRDRSASRQDTPPVFKQDMLRPMDTPRSTSATTGRSVTPVQTNESTTDDPTDDVQYSPGGRPLMGSRPQRERTPAPELEAGTRGREQVRTAPVYKGFSPRRSESPGSNAPIAVDPSTTPPPPPAGQSQIPKWPRQDSVTPATPATQAYQPFRYQSNESKSEAPSALPTHRRSSEQLPIRAIPVTEAIVSARASAGPQTAKGLKAILPSRRGPKGGESHVLSQIKATAGDVSDDFGFVRDLFRKWEDTSIRIRNQNEKDRRTREENQQEHADQLFAEKEIGYGDISALEDDFKKVENKLRAEEEEKDYERYVEKVFDPTYHELQQQIKRLMDQYAACIEVVKSAVAGKEALGTPNDRPDLAQIIELLFELDQRCELRHAKVFEAIVERDRRYKKTIIKPLYVDGDISRLKSMEKHFEESEKRSALDHALKKEERAKRLMDDIEENTMKGLGQDLDYMESITQEVRKLAELSLLPDFGAPQDLATDLPFAVTILQTLTTTSISLMRSFHAAALTLNVADFDISLAKARLANETPHSVEQLRLQKQEEDRRLAKELEHRVAVVREDFDKARRQIEEVAQRLDLPKPLDIGKGGDGGNTTIDQPPPLHPQSQSKGASRAGTPQQQPPQLRKRADSRDPEHEERLRKALEDAKKRNAARETSRAP